MAIVYEIMHKDRKVAFVDDKGRCKIYFPSFLPYNLYLEEEDDFDTLISNVTNFQYWCSSRLLTLDRVHAKEILNSAGLKQAVTDRDRAKVALTYHCLSLTDVYWVRIKGERVTFANVNLYENHLDNTFIDIALRGRQYTVQNEYLSRDLATHGVYPKAWQRADGGFQLLKDGNADAVERELTASRICRCFDANQVLYERGEFCGVPVSVSTNMTSPEYSIVPIEAFEIYCMNVERDMKKYILRLDRKNYYMMNIVDYLIGNTDRHWGNWGLLIDNSTNKPKRLHDLMDFNQAFRAYDQIDGANCQTCFGEKLSQREAALQAIQRIGLNQIRPFDEDLFDTLPEYREMFEMRLSVLKEADLIYREKSHIQ